MAIEANPRFSVIIPTKDRAEYLHHTLRTCSLQDYDNLDVIVSDDSSTDATREVVEEAARKDPRIRYVNPGHLSGMRDNFEFALNQVKPGYVLALGGDDGILPHGIRGMAEVLKETGQLLLSWPGPVFSYAGARMKTGQLILHRQHGIRIVRSKDILAKQVKDLNYVTDPELPMFYVKGVASTKLVESVRRRSPEGRFYTCPTPDGYSGIVLAGEVETYAFSGEPFTIFGASPTSQGVAYLSGTDKAKKQSEAFFRDVKAKPMHSDLGSQPYSPLISIMTADYLLTARDLPGWPGAFPPIDFKLLLKKGLAELSHGLYSEDRVARELSILNGIAEHHGLGPHFRESVRKAHRRMNIAPYEGNGVKMDSIILDCSQLGIEDIVDAAYAAHLFMRGTAELSGAAVWKMIVNSLAYRIRSWRRGDPFPPESEWTISVPDEGNPRNG
jgi:glycosyltransferase involved in cell wall biosynthesis